MSTESFAAHTRPHPPRLRARVGFPASSARVFRVFSHARVGIHPSSDLSILSLSSCAGIKKPKKHAKRSTKGMDTKFLLNQRYCKKGSKLAAAKAAKA
ncbi:hypothetical protein N9M16_01305 [Candidatus Dependentiae bacterium]|nr:hypothetical protein [Candidatus Dependentiae bacterium]